MISHVGYYPVLGKPLFTWFGPIGLSLLALAMLLMVWNKFSKRQLAFAWHMRLGALGFTLLLIHAALFFLAQ
jgi:hypothetical protein